MMQIFLAGLNHRNTPVEVREWFSFSQEGLEWGLTKLYQKTTVEECSVLSTCKRVEDEAEIKDWE